MASGCDRLHILVGSGNTVTRDFSLADFSRVSSGWTFNVEVSQAPGYSVKITVDDNLESYLNINKEGDTLRITMHDGYSYHSMHLNAVVTMPRITGLEISGASKGAVSGFNAADDFRLNVSGASQASLTNMGVNKLTMEVSGASRASGNTVASGNAVLQASGASTIELSGKAVDTDVESSGASKVDLNGFSVRDAHINVSGASNATINATGTLSGDVSGASRLLYIGTPTLGSLDISGASSVSRK
jgi:hypothetical protein